MPSKQKRILHIRVSNFESEFKFDIPYKSTGKQLLDLICKTVALRETWYFGLQYVTLDNRGDIKLLWWLRPHKKIADQVTSEPRSGVSGSAGNPGACGCGGEHAPSAVLRFLFHPKLYPEDVVKELIQDVTRHLFYLEVKNSLWRRRQDLATALLSSTTINEADVVTMACLAAHADNNGVPFWPATTPGSASTVSESHTGDTQPPESSGDLSELLTQMQAYLPSALVERWASILAVWESQVKPHYLSELSHLSREEAELEYLRLAQKQPFFGVSLHPIFDKSKRGNMLAVAAVGLQVYNDHRLVQAHSWSEIKNVSYRDRKFTLKLNRMSAPTNPPPSTTEQSSNSGQSSTPASPVPSGNQWIFWTFDQTESKAVMDLCVGSHELYVWRRRPETLEMQQIKAQAREERARKESERSRLSREREEKVAALEAKTALEGRCAELEMALRRSEETAELWAEKANVAEEEARLLQKKADQTAEALNQFHMDLENRTRDNTQSQVLARTAFKHDTGAAEARSEIVPSNSLALTRLAGVDTSSGEQLFLPMSPPLPRRAGPVPLPGGVPENLSVTTASINSATEPLSELEMSTASSDQLLAALERERQSFSVQKVRLDRQLRELRTEIDLIKNENRHFSLDRLPFFVSERVLGQTVINKFPSAQQVWSTTTKSTDG